MLCFGCIVTLAGSGGLSGAPPLRAANICCCSFFSNALCPPYLVRFARVQITSFCKKKNIQQMLKNHFFFYTSIFKSLYDFVSPPFVDKLHAP